MDDKDSLDDPDVFAPLILAVISVALASMLLWIVHAIIRIFI